MFSVPRSQFVRERNAMAARLRDAGRDDAAREVARLPKPTLVVWAINQAARGDRRAVLEFLGAVARWRRAYARGAADMSAATRAERRAVDSAVAAATGALGRAHGRVTPDVVRRITTTLHAAVANRTSAEALRRGRLTAEARLSGFELVPGVRRLAPGVRRTAPADAERRPGTAAARARQQGRPARAVERRTARQQRAAQAAERQAARLRERLRAAEARAAGARAAVEQARAEARGGR